MMGTTMSVRVDERILSDNDRIAARLRDRFADQNTLAVNLISSPGSGKTSLLESTVKVLGGNYRIGSVVGDVATERDADRLRTLGIPASQILTGGACHLDARQVKTVLDGGGFERLDFLFIENVGNLICPTSYDLGEDFKVALLSVTEGDDKPLKYPGIFSRAAVTVITKADLLPHVTFDLDRVRAEIRSLNPVGAILVTSARTGAGIREWSWLLRDRLASKLSVVSWVV
jgi:hydrogenase nickel incorporation protein HypB